MPLYSSALGLSIDQACSATGKNHERASNTPLIVLIRSEAFCRVSGLDERYHLYLQDAVLDRILDRYGGRCAHLSVAAKVQGWGRIGYRNLGLMAVGLACTWHFFRKWGLAL